MPDFHVGSIPVLDNLSVQLILLAVAESLKGPSVVEEILSGESIETMEDFKSIGLRTFCNVISETGLQVADVHEAITSKYSEPDVEDLEKKLFIKISQQKSLIKSDGKTENVEFLHDLKEEDHETYCNVILSLALRLCEPAQIEEIISSCKTGDLKTDVDTAMDVINARLQKHHIEIGLIEQLLSTKDLKSSKPEEQKACLKYEAEKEKVEITETTAVEPSRNFSKAVEAAKKIESKVRYSASETANNELEDEIYCLETLDEPLAQAGLVKITGPFYPTAILHEIIPVDVLKSESYDRHVGTCLVKKILRNTALSVEDMIKYVAIEDFSTSNLENTEKFIATLHSACILEPYSTEIAQSEKFTAFEKGLKVIKKVVDSEHDKMALNEVIDYLELAKIENFTKSEVQMGFLRLAKRVSNPLIVEEMVLDELSQKGVSGDCPMLGFKILASVAVKNPYSVTNIASFLSARDFSPAVIQAEKAYVESVMEEVNSPVVREELTERLMRKTGDIAAELPKLILEYQDSRTVTEHQSLHLLETFHHLDNIPAQAAMLGLATQISSLPEVYDNLALEMIQPGNILPTVGALAVQHVREHLPVDKEDMEVLVKEQIFDEKKQKKNLIIWENVASFLQSPKMSTEFVAENSRDEESICKAIRSLVTLIQEQTVIENQQLLSQLTNIPSTLKSLEAQIIMSTVSEGLLNAPIIEKIISQDLTGDNADSLPFFGFQALKTVVENQALTVKVDDHLLEIQDINKEMIKTKMALVLNTAHCIRQKVSQQFMISVAPCHCYSI